MKEMANKLKKKFLSRDNVKIAICVFVLFSSFMLLYLNQFTIQYYFNGFSAVFDSDLQVYFVDVGQANASLVVFPNKMAMLIDTGSKESSNNLVDEVEYILDKNNIDEIEYLILTHSDEDHVGGTKDVLKNFKVSNIFRPKLYCFGESGSYDFNVVDTLIYAETIEAVYNEPNCIVEFIEDKFLEFGDVDVEIFSCKEEKQSATNYYSPFVLIEGENKTFLFTADATAKREKEFLDQLQSSSREIDVDYLLVSHHGSKYSTTDEFLQKINADCAVVSCGDAKYPSREVLLRLEQNKIEDVYITRKLGTIGMGISNGVASIKTLSQTFDLPLLFAVFSIVVFVYMRFFPLKQINRFNFNIKSKSRFKKF